MDRLWVCLLGLIFVLGSCSGAKESGPGIQTKEFITIAIPQGFPEVDFPEDNLLSKERIELGRKFFYDVSLSRDRTVSCASCHFSEYAFSDTVKISPGEHGKLGERNAPPLHNVAYLPYLFKDGGIPNLELQIKAPVEDPNEMNFNMHELVLRMSEDSVYQRYARSAYSRDLDAFVITRALASFMRTFVSGESRYDHYLNGQAEFTELEKRGEKVFFSAEAKCWKCHDGFNFSDDSFRNNGSKEYYSDTGRARITLNTLDHGKFRVASLRNVELTAPYMHDGSYSSLNDVLDNYQKGGSGHWNQDPLISEIQLSDDDKIAVVAFLQTLTDETFIRNERFKALN